MIDSLLHLFDRTETREKLFEDFNFVEQSQYKYFNPNHFFQYNHTGYLYIEITLFTYFLT